MKIVQSSDTRQNHLPEIAYSPPLRRTIAICDVNPVLADGMRQMLLGDAHLSDFDMVSVMTPDLDALRIMAPDILIIDPWQRSDPIESVADAFLGLSDVTSLIGYCSGGASSDARALSLMGFRGIMPKTVRSEELIRIVCAVAFGGVFLHQSYTEDTTQPVRPSRSGSAPLTEREIQVLRQLALGSSMKEIATLLQISTKTVDTYKTRASRKLNLRSRSDIVKYAIQCGWMC